MISNLKIFIVKFISKNIMYTKYQIACLLHRLSITVTKSQNQK